MANYNSNNFKDTVKKMTEKMQNDLSKLDNIGKFVVKYGVPAKQTEKGKSISDYAILNNYGSFSKNIPPRPFLSTVQERYISKISKNVLTALEKNKQLAIGQNELDKNKTENIVSKYIAMPLENYTKDNLLKGDWQANSSSTINKKGSSVPLVDSGQLFQSIIGIVQYDK